MQRQDVALKLKITPHVNESDYVRLEIDNEISDVSTENFNGLGPTLVEAQGEDADRRQGSAADRPRRPHRGLGDA